MLTPPASAGTSDWTQCLAVQPTNGTCNQQIETGP